jgi:hypothetical protein
MIRGYIVVAVVVFSISVALFLRPDVPITGSTLLLGSGGYDMQVINAPATKGSLLDMLSRVLSQSFLGPYIRRVLLNDNKVHMLRELSSQIELAPMTYPLYRMTRSERTAHDEVAELPENSIERALEVGFEGGTSKYATVMDYADLYRSQKATPTQVLRRTLEAIRSWEKQGFRIFSSLIEQDVMRQAAESDRRHAQGLPLSVFDGVPIAVKDLLEVTGHVIYDGQNPKNPTAGVLSVRDDVVVERFRSLGAIILGVTIMTEAGMSPYGFNIHFQGPTNAFSSGHYSGGSSSGSAVSVATGNLLVCRSRCRCVWVNIRFRRTGPHRHLV